ncbi:MAG: hypothetical protein IT265_07095 [Saprospiraceae bacterium]|nr:hypothetical protein [Saprospiraceae bacterium]
MPINYKLYPDNWLTEIRPSILKRANNCCEHCGIANYQVYRFLPNGDREQINYFDEQTYNNARFTANMANLGEDIIWRVSVLTVAHLDHDINHNESENLKALCQKCHLSYDRPHHREIRIRKKRLNVLVFQ